MAEVFSVTNHLSFGSRLGRSCKGIVAGLIFGAIGTGILVFNEGNYVRQHKALQEAARSVVEVTASPLDGANEGKLIHIIGKAEASSDEPLSDPLFGVQEPNSLKLSRSVEMYQWIEEIKTTDDKKPGGSSQERTTYTYDKAWKSQVVPSSTFRRPEGHGNPTFMPYSANVVVADPIALGDFVVSKSVSDLMKWFEPIHNPVSVESIPDASIRSKATSMGTGFYIGPDPSLPEVGDVRVQFTMVPEQTVSIVAKQISNSFSPYTAKSGGTVLLVEAGVHDAADMFVTAALDLSVQTWIFRVLGFFLLFFMFKSWTQPMEVFADIIPFFGNMVGVVGSLISFLLAACLSTIIIAVAWLWYRPFLSIVLLGGVAGVLYFMKCQGRNGTCLGRQGFVPTATLETHSDKSDAMEMTRAVPVKCIV